MQLTSVGLLLALAAPTFAQSPLKQVAIVDARMSNLVEDGRRRSATFRGLIDQLERSEWMVFVQSGNCPDRAAIGCMLHIVGNFDGRRYLRVLVNSAGRHPDQVITILAHELQHSIEVVTSGTVTDVGTLMLLQERLASSRVQMANGKVYETAAARKVEELVFRELRQR